jgi:hypothetical protein
MKHEEYCVAGKHFTSNKIVACPGECDFSGCIECHQEHMRHAGEPKRESPVA